jgi:hypothetical protein
VADDAVLVQLDRWRDRVPVFGPLLLYCLPLPLLPAIFIALIRGSAVDFVTALGAFLLLMASAWSIRRGMKRGVELQRLGWSRLPPAPWKLLGAIGSGLATAACSLFIIGNSSAASAVIGVTAAAGVLLSYGLDGLFLPRARRDPMATRDREVAQALREAKLRIDNIDLANRQIHNPEFRRRIRRITRQAVDILTTIADDPTTLRRARRFLKVYLDGVEKVTERYARLHPDHGQGRLEDNFRHVLVTIEDTFAEQQRKLMEKDLMDLDVQIEVLTTQLRNEGVI